MEEQTFNYLEKNKDNENFEVELAKTTIPVKEKSRTAFLEEREKEKETLSSEKEEGQLTVDIYQTPNEIVIIAPIAGVEPEDIDISLSGDMITIKGEREIKPKESEVDYLYQECFWGKFSRTIILPCEVQADKIKASLKKGILTIKLPKAEKNKVKKIKISTSE